jgi:hypothetical protein
MDLSELAADAVTTIRTSYNRKADCARFTEGTADSDVVATYIFKRMTQSELEHTVNPRPGAQVGFVLRSWRSVL